MIESAMVYLFIFVASFIWVLLSTGMYQESLGSVLIAALVSAAVATTLIFVPMYMIMPFFT